MSALKLLLQRTHTDGARTWGKLFADGVFVCYTLEDAIREVADEPVQAWKIKGATAIPSTHHAVNAGRPYIVTLETSPKYGADCPTVVDVPGFQYIRMHSGNTEADTEGCLLLGLAIDATGIVGGTSRRAVEIVRRLLVGARDAGQAIELEICNPTEAA